MKITTRFIIGKGDVFCVVKPGPLNGQKPTKRTPDKVSTEGEIGREIVQPILTCRGKITGKVVIQELHRQLSLLTTGVWADELRFWVSGVEEKQWLSSNGAIVRNCRGSGGHHNDGNGLQ